MTKNRDDFTELVKRTLGERASYICANPDCREPTIGPHSDPEKSLKTGEACHIHAAAAGGPRYDSLQTPEQRRSVSNGIWLCNRCSTIIDNDAAPFPAEILLKWKSDHEEWIGNGGIVPATPMVAIHTLNGRSVPEFPTKITSADINDFREHHLKIENIASVELRTIDARIQTPEPIIASEGRHRPAGVDVHWAPIRPQMVATVTGNARIERLGPPMPTSVYRLQIDRLLPKQCVEIGFITTDKPFDDHDFTLSSDLWAGTNEPPMVRFFFDGTFQFEYRGDILSRRVFAPFRVDDATRRVSVVEIRGDYGTWKPMLLSLFS